MYQLRKEISFTHLTPNQGHYTESIIKYRREIARIIVGISVFIFARFRIWVQWGRRAQDVMGICLQIKNKPSQMEKQVVSLF